MVLTLAFGVQLERGELPGRDFDLPFPLVLDALRRKRELFTFLLRPRGSQLETIVRQHEAEVSR